MGERKLTKAQTEILSFMSEHGLRHVSWYDGPPGARKYRGEGYYFPITDAPKIDARSMDGLIRRELFEYVGGNDYAITDAGRSALEASK